MPEIHFKVTLDVRSQFHTVYFRFFSFGFPDEAPQRRRARRKPNMRWCVLYDIDGAIGSGMYLSPIFSPSSAWPTLLQCIAYSTTSLRFAALYLSDKMPSVSDCIFIHGSYDDSISTDNLI